MADWSDDTCEASCDVRYLLEGSVRRAGSQLRITAQLIDGATDAHLRAEKYGGTIDDVFAMQERISGSIVNELRARLTSDEVADRGTRVTDAETYELYLRARQMLGQSLLRLPEADPLLEAAIRRDPGFGPAYCALGSPLVVCAFFGYLEPTSAWARIQSLADRALAANPRSGPAHALLAAVATYRDWNWAEARRLYARAAELRHLACELHDEIGQSLTAAEMNLQAALQLRGSEALGRRLEDSIQAVERVLEQVHDLSLNLRPSMLDDLGLEPALRWYTQRQAALTGLHAEFRADISEERLDPLVETECSRVAQEALTNVVRHAHAHGVTVELTKRNGHLHLSVRDDGVGFDVAGQREKAIRGASLGLLSMDERASLAGGGLELRSIAGCTVHR